MQRAKGFVSKIIVYQNLKMIVIKILYFLKPLTFKFTSIWPILNKTTKVLQCYLEKTNKTKKNKSQKYNNNKKLNNKFLWTVVTKVFVRTEQFSWKSISF